jgi:triosephosphate isomerase
VCASIIPSPSPPPSPPQGLGAYTGSHTVDQVKDSGIPWVLAGHSERRTIWKEADAETAAKAKATLDAGLASVVCIGETLTEREAGQTLEVCFRQLKAVVDVLAAEQWARVVVAYEPVWAIGTGKVATKEQAQEVHAALRAWIATNVSAPVAEAVRIVYGGSVNVRERGARGGSLTWPPFFPVSTAAHTASKSPYRAPACPTLTLLPLLLLLLLFFFSHSTQAANCVSLITEKDIDGFLVGGASLKPEFVDIIKSTASKA